MESTENTNAAQETCGRKATSPEKHTFPGARVLLCEDDMINQDVAASILEMFGIDPVIAENGAEAISFLNEAPFDLVLMDISMPVLSGCEATIKIRSSSKPYKNVPIVAMTGGSSEEETDKCREAGMNGCVLKPIDIDVLYEEIKKWLQKSEESADVGGNMPVAAISIEEIDTECGLKRFNNKSDRYIKALASFSNDLPESIEEIVAGASESRLEAARESAHRIKGVAGNIGAMKLFQAAGRLEDVFANGENYEAALSEFIQCAEVVIMGISKALLERESCEPSTEKPAGEIAEALLLLSELEQSAKQFDPEASERIIGLLREKEWIGLDYVQLHEIYRLAGDYLFDEVCEKISLLLTGRDTGV